MALDVPLLLLISLDGFRHDFVSESGTPNLWRLAQNGSRFARGVQSQFPTNTVTNHYAILSGLHSASSGIVGNVFYDPVFGDTSDYWNFTGNQSRWEDSRRSRWFSGEPIWLSNEKASAEHRSGSMRFPMGDIQIGPQERTAFRKKPWLNFTGPKGWADDADELIRWFKDPAEPINFGLLYIPQPDEDEHLHGVHSKQVSDDVAAIDSFIGDLMAKLMAANLWDRMNLIVTGDHGHIDCVYPNYVVPLGDYAWLYEEEKFHRTALVSWMAPKGTNESQSRRVFERLRSEMVDRDKQPVSLLYRPDVRRRIAEGVLSEPYDYLRGYIDSRRVGDILLFGHANESIAWRIEQKRREELSSLSGTHGQHGFTSPHLLANRALLILRGPAFKSGHVSTSDDVENIDLFPLMCQVLEIACPAVNGSLGRVSEVLLSSSALSQRILAWSLDHASLFVIILCIAFPAVAFALYCLDSVSAGGKRRRRRKGYDGYSQLQPNGVANGELLGLEDVDAMSEDEL